MKRPTRGFTRGHIPLALILITFAWSAITIAMRRTEEAPPHTQVLRIGHWQLEAGVREAFDKLGHEFAARPDIQQKYGHLMIVQDAIPDSIYGQWLTSQMMGQTAPDLLEVGLLPQPVLLAYQSRYFLPLSDIAGQPNPFNRGTPMEGVQLRQTFLDGMRSGYQEELQAYMRVNLSRFTSRVFYNKSLLQQLTGLSEPPHDLAGFLDLCRHVASHRLPNSSQHYIPITSSSYHAGSWFNNTADPLTYANLFLADFSRDGSVGSDETYIAIATGRMTLNDPTWRADFAVTRDLIAQFNPGFAGVGRDEALFLFAQQKAVFISTGIWEISSLQSQAEGKFQVGIADFPKPSPDDPRYARLALGPLYDPAGASFPFGVYRLSKNPDLAKDFLLFLASVHGNEELNRIVGWIPSVANVPLPPDLARFAPNDQGIYPNGSLTLGGNTYNDFNKFTSEFQTNPDYSYQQFAHDFSQAYQADAPADFDEQQRDWQRSQINTDKTLTAQRGQLLLQKDADWSTYNNYILTRQVVPTIEHAQIRDVIDHPNEHRTPPYNYTPEALQHARRQLEARP